MGNWGNEITIIPSEVIIVKILAYLSSKCQFGRTKRRRRKKNMKNQKKKEQHK